MTPEEREERDRSVKEIVNSPRHKQWLREWRASPGYKAFSVKLRRVKRRDQVVETKLMAAFPTAQSYVCEDPDKFGAGMVVVEDGSTRRMMITKTICGFVETIWNERRVGRSVMCRNIFHGSVLTLDANQNWTPYA